MDFGCAASSMNQFFFGMNYISAGSTSNTIFFALNGAPRTTIDGNGTLTVNGGALFTSPSSAPTVLAITNPSTVGGTIQSSYYPSMLVTNTAQQNIGVSNSYCSIFGFNYTSTTVSQNYLFLGLNGGTFVNIKYDGSLKINNTVDASTYDGTTGSLQVNHS